jgi:hypothetical protein
MRRSQTTLTLVLAAGLLALCAAVAIAMQAGGSAHGNAGRAGVAEASHSWTLRLSAAPDDLTLAELDFPKAAHGQRIAASTLQLAVGSPFGDDYLVAGAPQLAAAGPPRLLVMLVNRPSGLLDPVDVPVRLTARAALGSAVVRRFVDPLSGSAGKASPRLCNLPLHGGALSGAELRTLRTRGTPLAGFDAAGALAQAYDLVCGLARSSSFAQAVERSGSPTVSEPQQPTTSTSTSTPSPAPPVGKLPDEGCVPTPGYACPEASPSGSGAAAGG